MGMLGVANREGEYSSEQQADPEVVTLAIVQALTRQKVEMELRQAEKALVESEQRLRAIIDGSDNAFYVKDLDGLFILINKHLEKLLGMNCDEVIEKTDYDFFIPELADCYKMHDSKILETGVPEQLEEVSYLVDGWHTFLANKFSLYDSHGQLYAICGISADITERKRKEEELNEAQSIAHLGSWYWDAKTDENIASDELLRIFGQVCPPFQKQRGTMYPTGTVGCIECSCPKGGANWSWL
jgi:PAS domain S-box-containing protein